MQKYTVSGRIFIFAGCGSYLSLAYFLHLTYRLIFPNNNVNLYMTEVLLGKLFTLQDLQIY